MQDSQRKPLVDRVRCLWVRCLVVVTVAAVIIVFCPSGDAQPVLGTDFDSILGPFDADFLVSGGAELEEEAVVALTPTAAAIQAAIANEIASLAISAAGTQYFFAADRSFYVSGNLGSFFIEPPWTSGQGSWSLGLNVTELRFDNFNGKQLDSLFDFDSYVPFLGQEVRVLESNYDLYGTLYTLSGTLGVAEDWDVGFVLPYVKLMGKGDWAYSYLGVPLADFHETAEGISDIFLRTKYELLEIEDLYNLTTWSVGADIKLPNGDEDELLGTGDWGYRLRTLAGKRFWRIYPTVELAYYWAGVDAIDDFEIASGTVDTGIDGNDFDAFEFNAAVPINLIEEKWTVSAEYLLRRYNRSGPHRTAVDWGFSTRFKINDYCFIQGGVRIPQDENGLRAEYIPTIGGEFRF